MTITNWRSVHAVLPGNCPVTGNPNYPTARSPVGLCVQPKRPFTRSSRRFASAPLFFDPLPPPSSSLLPWCAAAMWPRLWPEATANVVRAPGLVVHVVGYWPRFALKDSIKSRPAHAPWPGFRHVIVIIPCGN